MELQSGFGVDIAMVLDVCPPFPAERARDRGGLPPDARLGRALAGAPTTGRGCSSGSSRAERTRTCGGAARRTLVALDFPGYAIGGVAVGESKEAIRDVTALSAALLPEEKPRYLMGVGTPADLLASVRAGVDLFDCVLPTRNGRMGHAYTRARRDRDQARALQGGPRAARPGLRAARSAGGTAARTCGISSC